MTDDAQFDAIAERVREGLSRMMEAIGSELSGQPDPPARATALGAMSTGAILQTVEFFLNASVIQGIPFPEARKELDRLVDDYWKQVVVRHYAGLAAEKKP